MSGPEFERDGESSSDDIWPETTTSRWCAKHDEEAAECWSGHYCAWSASRMPHTEHGYCVGYLPHLAVGLRNLMDYEAGR